MSFPMMMLSQTVLIIQSRGEVMLVAMWVDPLISGVFVMLLAGISIGCYIGLCCAKVVRKRKRTCREKETSFLMHQEDYKEKKGMNTAEEASKVSVSETDGRRVSGGRYTRQRGRSQKKRSEKDCQARPLDRLEETSSFTSFVCSLEEKDITMTVRRNCSAQEEKYNLGKR